MAWQRKVTEILADVLRFAAHGALLVDGIAVAIASVYVIVKLCWFTVQYLDSTIFSQPW